MSVTPWADLCGGNGRRDGVRDVGFSSAACPPVSGSRSSAELVGIGELSAALGRSPGTVRRWERAGIIPLSPFFVDSPDPRGRRRRYDLAWIEVVVAAAQAEGMLDQRRTHFHKNRFAQRLAPLHEFVR